MSLNAFYIFLEMMIISSTRGEATAFSAFLGLSIKSPLALYFFPAMFYEIFSVGSFPRLRASSVMFIERELSTGFSFLGALVGRRAPSGIAELVAKLLLWMTPVVLNCLTFYASLKPLSFYRLLGLLDGFDVTLVVEPVLLLADGYFSGRL